MSNTSNVSEWRKLDRSLKQVLERWASLDGVQVPAKPKSTWNERHTHTEEPCYDWEFESSKARAGGRKTIYTTLMFPDGCLSCNCPGWTFKKGDEPRRCKHTDMVLEEAKEVRKAIKNGEDLPISTVAPPLSGSTVRRAKTTNKSTQQEGEFNRSLEID